MPLSLNEIRSRAIAFANEWKDDTSEDQEAKSFWDAFFDVFGVPRRRVASFEQPVKKTDNKQGFIDLLWKGNLLVEHKSKGKDLDTAYRQAKDYFPGLKDHELPRYILVSDFARFKLYDLDDKQEYTFPLAELYKNINLFGFISGYSQKKYKDEDPVNIEAAELMGKLHDAFVENGYAGHELEVFLVRLLFCLFAEDTAIFEKHQFTEFIDLRTREDGSDLGSQLSHLFQVLNTPPDKRPRNLDEQLNAFPYINGALFAEFIPILSCDVQMREKLLRCCYFDWTKISPAVFGSMFQSVMDAEARRNLGAHYTSEKNILKVIKSLFLDELHREFESIQKERGQAEKRRKLGAFHDKISRLTFLDPACGCGNFLIITYRELRLLEMEILKQLQEKQLEKGLMTFDTRIYSKIDVDTFYGIEYEEFAAQIAQVAMWLVDHQMNIRLSQEFGQYFVRIPLQKSATVVHGNALRIDWQSLLKTDENTEKRFDYILGNPPFVGSKLLDDAQRHDMQMVFGNAVAGAGVLDYVSAWYYKAALYLQNATTKAAFVSTNSVTQGEQVGILWGEMLKLNVKIHFAHRTFKWSNEARGNANVFVVIVGFATYNTPEKHLYEYETPKSQAQEVKAQNINPYLVDAPDVLVTKRSNPLCDVPEMSFGNMPLDGGNLLLSDSEKADLLVQEPLAEKFLKPLISAREFLNNQTRWCLWLVNIQPYELKSMPIVLERVKKVKEFRESSKAPSTQKFAATPTLFRDKNQPDSFVVVPRVSSENRKYIPFGFFDGNSIVSDTCMFIADAALYHFGILTSEMHMAWVKYVCGRLKSDFRYSKDLVYNNFPWPQNVSPKQEEAVSKAAEKVLETRQRYPASSLADLYDPLTMPPDLVKAHTDLDRAVDACYRPQPFTSEMQRIEFLFERYKQLTEPLFEAERKKKAKAT